MNHVEEAFSENDSRPLPHRCGAAAGYSLDTSS